MNGSSFKFWTQSINKKNNTTMEMRLLLLYFFTSIEDLEVHTVFLFPLGLSILYISHVSLAK